MVAPYQIQRGETLVVPLEAVGATSDDLTGVTVAAGLKRAVNGRGVPPAGTARVATFTIAERAGTADVGPGWNLSLTATETAALEPGTYVTDAVLTLPGGTAVQITEPLLIRIEQAVSV